MRFDWPALMRVGLQGLGMQPRDFWRLTPAELAMMLGEDAGTAPIGRARLAELERLYGASNKESKSE